MVVPNIHRFTDCRSFLAELYTQNRKENEVGSFRYYARKLNWPVSYLNEVIQGKKNLTLNRAVELGIFLNLDGVDVERLIFLALKENESEVIREYFSKKIKSEGETAGYFRPTPAEAPAPEETLIIPEEIYSDLTLLAINDAIVWADGQITPQRIGELLFTFPELAEPKFLATKLEILQKHGLVEPIFEKSQIVGFKFQKKRLFFAIDKKTVVHMGQYAENYRRILESSQQRGWISSGFIKISRVRLAEFKKRFLAFRNWVLEVDRECLESTPGGGHESMLFQFDLNLLAMLDCEKLGIPKFNDWMAQAPNQNAIAYSGAVLNPKQLPHQESSLPAGR